jgi:predicted DNA-binding transcriptional regulator YafY
VNRTDRLMGILLELQARGELRAEDLAGTFEVSVRTIYRDVEALCETGVPVVATPGKGYRLMEGYFLPPLTFTADEAALLILGGELVRERVDPLLRPAAESALRTLAGVLPADRRAEMERRRQGMFFASVAGQANDHRLVLARRAIEERRVVRLLYHALRRDQPAPRDVEPIRLIHFTDAWYLAGYCRLRQGVRMFRLDRIDRLEILGERYTPAARHAVPEPHERRPLDAPEARVRFDDRVLRWVRERQPFTLLREEQDAVGPVFLYALRDEQELLTWLLTWGSAVEVLGPDSLRASLAEEARAILARHARRGETGAIEPSRPAAELIPAT